MSIITKMRRQNAIYWPPAEADRYGVPSFGTAVELVVTAAGNYRVRWEDTTEQFIDSEGTTREARALVYVPLLPDGSEVKKKGWLWLGDVGDLTDAVVPTNNADAGEIMRFDKLPTLKATEFLRSAYL